MRTIGGRRPAAGGRVIAVAVGLVMAGAAQAQLSEFNPLPGPRGVYAIRNVRIVPVSGPVVARGNVVIGRDGKIQAVGVNAAIPNGAQTLDGTGLSVYPGMMDAGTTIGLNEISGIVQMADGSEVGSFNPNVHAYFGLNTHSAHIGVTRVVGITHVVSRPSGGIIAGQATLINLSGDNPAQMAVVRDVAMVVAPPGTAGAGRGGGRGGGGAAPSVGSPTAMDSLRQLLRDADIYGKAQDAYEKDRSLPRPARDVVLDALVPVVRGRMPVFIPAGTATAIRDAVTFAESIGAKPILYGAAQALQSASFLKERNVGVIFTGTMSVPAADDDPYDLNYATPAKLAAAGVKFALASGSGGAEVRNLPYVAGMAAAFGLSKDDALRAVTLWPAEIFGVADRLGSIEVGKIANLVVTNGDMLEARTDTKALFIDGRPVPLGSKHTYLFELYKDRKGQDQ